LDREFNLGGELAVNTTKFLEFGRISNWQTQSDACLHLNSELNFIRELTINAAHQFDVQAHASVCGELYHVIVRQVEGDQLGAAAAT
jgi:hypothetical protein